MGGGVEEEFTVLVSLFFDVYGEGLGELVEFSLCQTYSDVTQVSTFSIAISLSSVSESPSVAVELSPRRALRAGVAMRSCSRMTILHRWLW